jgi:type IV pilus assembly protein PilX
MNRIQSQHGGALIVGLVTLLVMTVIGTASMQGAALEEKMAGNARSRDLAFQAAESALRAGEDWLMDKDKGQPLGSPVPCTAQPDAGLDDSKCYMSSGEYPAWKLVDDLRSWTDDGRATLYGENLAQDTAAAGKPSYVVERLQSIDDAANGGLEAGTQKPQKHYYRITAHGHGATADAVAVVQSTYRTNN